MASEVGQVITAESMLKVVETELSEARRIEEHLAEACRAATTVVNERDLAEVQRYKDARAMDQLATIEQAEVMRSEHNKDEFFKDVQAKANVKYRESLKATDKCNEAFRIWSKIFKKISEPDFTDLPSPVVLLTKLPPPSDCSFGRRTQAEKKLDYYRVEIWETVFDLLLKSTPANEQQEQEKRVQITAALSILKEEKKLFSLVLEYAEHVRNEQVKQFLVESSSMES